MSTGGRAVDLKTLMQGSYELYGQAIANGRPNLGNRGDAPQSSGPMNRHRERRQQVEATKRQRKEKDNEQQPSGPHANSLAPEPAILFKNERDYRRKGATYIRENRASEYDNFTHLSPAKFQADVAFWAGITPQPSNFNPMFSGESQPYPWRAHHLIPGEAFYTEDTSGKPVFDKEENFKILKQTPYDIDHGHNMILLPSQDWAVPVHALLHHPCQHNGYSLDVMDGLKEIDLQIDTLRGQGKPHEAIVAKVFKELQNLESELWDILIEESRKAVRGAAEGKLYKGSWTRWKDQKGKKEYLWPALW